MRALPATLKSHCTGAGPSGRAGSASSCAPRRQRIPRAAAAATRRQWQPSRAAAGAAAAPLVAPLPHDYDWRGDIMPETREIIAAQYPQLQDLVDSGEAGNTTAPSCV